MYLLGYDVGSSSVKASLVSVETGKCVATAFYPKSEAPIMSKQPGFAEQDPAMWWANLKLATADILEQVRGKATLQRKAFSPADIKAIGISALTEEGVEELLKKTYELITKTPAFPLKGMKEEEEGGMKVYDAHKDLKEGDFAILHPSEHVFVITGEEVLADPYGRKYTNLARCSCYKIFRRSVIEQAGLRFTCGIPIGEDELFATQFYAYAGKVAICPQTAGYLRIFRSGSALLSISTKKLLPRIKIAEVLYATWKKRPSNGMTTRLAANLVMLAHLGGNYDHATRAECIEALLDSTFFNHTGIPFVLKHGTWKARLFAATYLLSPKSLRRKLLLQRAQGK
jgi:hypothetical protein